MMEDFKQEIAAVEKQIATKYQELKLLKQYKKSIENAMRLKQKVEGKQKPAPYAPEKNEAEPGG